MTTSQPGQNDGKRLQTVLDSLYISANKMANLLEYKSPASIYHVLEGRNKLSSDMIEKIIKKFPSVNYKYLKAGKEEPLLSSDKEKQHQQDLFGFRKSTKSDDDMPEIPKKDPLSYNVAVQLQEIIDQARIQNEYLSKIVAQNNEIKSLLVLKRD